MTHGKLSVYHISGVRTLEPTPVFVNRFVTLRYRLNAPPKQQQITIPHHTHYTNSYANPCTERTPNLYSAKTPTEMW